MPLTLGSERLLASGRLKGQRIGVVSNPASVDSNLGHIVDRLASYPGARLTAIFGPQHGLRSDVQDNMIETLHTEGEMRRAPVYSLYRIRRKPTAAILRNAYMLGVERMDVSVRIYTYI